MAYINTILQAAEILTKPFTNMTSGLRHSSLCALVNIKSRPGKPRPLSAADGRAYQARRQDENVDCGGCVGWCVIYEVGGS